MLTRAFRAVLGGGDHLLFLLCLLLPVRRLRTAAGLLLALTAGQIVSIVASALLAPPGAVALPAVAMFAASALVMAALQAVVGAGQPWTWLLALVFGAANGFTFGSTLVAARQFAGSHVWIALAAFLAVVVLAELWMGVLGWAARLWLDTRGASERGLVLIGAAIIAHSGVHAVMDRGQAFAQTGAFGAGHAVAWLAAGWVCAVLLTAAPAILRDRAGRHRLLQA